MTSKAKQELLEKAEQDERFLQAMECRTPEGIRKAVMRKSKENGRTLPSEADGGGYRAMYELAKQNVEDFMGVQASGEQRYKTVDELRKAISKYWDLLIKAEDSDEPLIADVEGLCQFLGISRRTLQNWERQNHNGFGPLIAETRTAIAACNKQLAKKGKMPALVFMADMNNNHEYVQKQQVEIESSQLSQEKMTPEQLKAALDGMKESALDDDVDSDDFDIEACFTVEDDESNANEK